MGLMLVFMVAQGLWISRYMAPAEGDAPQGTGQAPGERP